jgi:sulfane dehydrogenase subunit SoxC
MTARAGNGLLSRRHFVAGGAGLLVATPVALAGLDLPPGMTRPGGSFGVYGQPSPHEKHTARAIAANRDLPGNGVSWTPLQDLEGTITPSGLHFERHHGGVPEIDPAAHRLSLHGRVGKPLVWAVAELLRYPRVSRQLFIECGGNSNSLWNAVPRQTSAGAMHGLASCSEWTGVPLRLLLEEAAADKGATWLIAEGADAGGLHLSIPMQKALDDCMVALWQNGERLRPEQGYPMRLVVPGWEGVTHVKWLHRLELAREPAMSRFETGRYTDLLPSGKARQFSFVIEPKSVITNPSPGQLLRDHGVYQISGLAWSGRGAVRKVEVSADGGKTWALAALDGPVQRQCFTRFRIPWRWLGQAALLKSRVTDETGATQPERAALVADRGRHGEFHFNGIVCWAVDEDGEVSHVYA